MSTIAGPSEAPGGVVTGMPLALLRIEAATVLIASLICYRATGGGLRMFALLIFVPDLSMTGFLAGKRVGAAVYNLAHFYAWPIGCIAWGIVGHTMLPTHVGLIWAAHIGFDRMIRAGLKYPTGFRYSHLGTLTATSGGPPLAVLQPFAGRQR